MLLMIDRVTDLEPRKRASAIKCVTYNEPFFPGHFPGHPVGGTPGGGAEAAGQALLNSLTGYFATVGEGFCPSPDSF